MFPSIWSLVATTSDLFRLMLSAGSWGLLDTVGALGVPKITPGVDLSYEFYDQDVSWEVQTVCQALATHDRMSLFTPCFVRRSAKKKHDFYQGTQYNIEEVWFPGDQNIPSVHHF